MRLYFLAFLILIAASQDIGARVISMGRLFKTPADRATLDRLRQLGKLGEEIKVEPADKEQPSHEQSQQKQLTLNGFVKRSSGNDTTWINQMTPSEQKKSSSIQVTQQFLKPPNVSILLPTGERLMMKPGQTYDSASGKINEAYDARYKSTKKGNQIINKE